MLWTTSISVKNNPSVSQSLTSSKKDKVKCYIRLKTYDHIALRFWIKSGVKCFMCVRLMSFI